MVLQDDIANLSKRLSQGEDCNVRLADGSTPIHTAAAEGNIRCLKLLLANGGDISIADDVGRTPLYSAASHGHVECVELLLEHGGSITAQTQAGWTAIHAAIQNDHLDCLALFLSWRRTGFLKGSKRDEEGSSSSSSSSSDKKDSLAEHCGTLEDLAQQHVFPTNPDGKGSLHVETTTTSSPKVHFCTLAELLALRDQDGWTPAHLAASKDTKTSLQLLLASCQSIDLQSQDKWGKTVHDVASTACKEMLDALGSDILFCSIYLEWTKSFGGKNVHQQIGIVSISKDMSWSLLEENVVDVLCRHFDTITKSWNKKTEDDPVDNDQNSLGLGTDSVAALCIGDEKWIPGQSMFQSTPFGTFMNNDVSTVIVKLKGASENNVQDVAYRLLFPVATIQNYLRLLEQYKSVVFYGPIGSSKSSLAYELGHLLKNKQRNRWKWKVFKIDLAVEESEKLLDRLLAVGCLRKTSSDSSTFSNPIVILDHLTPEVTSRQLANILPLLDTRGESHNISLAFSSGKTHNCYIPEDCFIIATVNRFRSLGFNLVAQQRCRWVHLRPDAVPCRQLLWRHAIRRCGPCESPPVVKNSLEWLQTVWERTNQTLAKLGIVELAFGPLVFLPPKKELQNSSQLVGFVSNLWNDVLTLAVERAMTEGIRPLTEQQVRTVDAALIVLLQRAVLPDCPLTLQDRETYLPHFRGCTNVRLLSRKMRLSWGSYPNSPDKEHPPGKGFKRLSDPTENLVITCNNLLKSEPDVPKNVSRNVSVLGTAKTRNDKSAPHFPRNAALSKTNARSSTLSSSSSDSPVASASSANSPSASATHNKRAKTGHSSNASAANTTNAANAANAATSSSRNPPRKINLPRVKKIVSPVTPRSFSFLSSSSTNKDDKAGNSSGPSKKGANDKK